jgi:putative transposase
VAASHSPAPVCPCAEALNLLGLHQAVCKQKYRMLFSSNHNRKPGPKGPSAELVHAIVEMKQRNPRWGCPRIAEQITLAFNLAIDKDSVRRILAHHHWPGQSPGGPSWLTFLGHMKRKPMEYGSVPL